MKPTEAKTIEDLKSIGTVNEIQLELEEIIFPLKISASCYEDLLTAIEKLREKWTDLTPGPFVSRQAEVIFYLTKLDGKVRNDFLGITDDMYGNNELLKNWYRGLLKYVHSDRIHGENKGDPKPFQNLTKLYEQLTYEGDSNE